MQKSTTKKLNVAFVLDDGLDKPDGVQQHILTLGSWLENKGYGVTYLVGETNRPDIPNAISMTSNLKVRFNGNSLSTPLPASSKKIRRILADKKFDVIHVQVPYSPFMGAKVVKLASKNTRIIGTFHILPVGKMQYIGTKLLGLWLRRNLKKFDQFFSVSGPAQDFAKQTFNIDSEVLANPVDISKFKPKTPRNSKEINITFLGRLVPRKGCKQLLIAVSKLIEKDSSIKLKLDICGNGHQRAELEKYVRNSNLKNVTTFHGFIAEKDKPKFLSNTDFAVFPSSGGESFGIVLIEAMAAKAGVVLGGNNPGYASVLPADCLFSPKDTDELSDKIYDLIKNKDKFASIHEHQQVLVKQYDANLVGQKLLVAYQSTQ